MLLDVLTAQQGYLQLVATSRRNRQFSLYCQYEADWQRDRDWPKIVASHEQRRFLIQGDHLYCCAYLSELMVRLLPPGEPVASLFRFYLQVLDALANGQVAEPWLRIFEYRLLVLTGYGFSWSHDANGCPVLARQRYRFACRQGFVESADGWPGEWILAMANTAVTTPAVWKMARQVLRLALDDCLDEPLFSRMLLTSPGAGCS